MELPEWFGYLAAFEAYTEAVKRGDLVTAEQARKLMSMFAEELVPTAGRGGRRRLLKDEEAIRYIIEILEDRE